MANEYLKRTPTSTGNRKIFTYAGWFKKNYGNDVRFDIFNAYNTGNQQEEIGFRGDSFRYLSSGSTLYGFDTTNKYRDTGNWFHIVFALNTTLESERKRSVIYINGVEVDTTTSSGIGAYVAKNFDSIAFNVTGKEHNVLARKYSSSGRDYVEGQAFDVFFVDGQALTPDVFGFHKDGDGYMSSGTSQATDFRPGQWMPHSPAKIKKDVNRSGGFGVNGFYLPMNDSSNPGADFHCAPNSIIKLKGEDLPQPRNGAPTTSDAYVSQLRQEVGTLGFDGVVKFDGSGDYLAPADSSDFAFGTGDFTIECFNYFNDFSALLQTIFDTRTSSETLGFGVFADSSGRWRIDAGTGSGFSAGTIGNATSQIWQHVALTRESGTVKFFVDGILKGSVSNTTDLTGQRLTIGFNYDRSSWAGDGYISNFRLVKGTALYTANFTPPTEPLTNVTNTKLLCCNSSTSATAATVTPGSITANGNAFATKNELTGSIALAVPGIALENTNTELVTNGDFSNGTTGWTGLSGGSLSVEGNRLKITETTNALDAYAVNSTAITTVSGTRYTIKWTFHEGTNTTFTVRFGNSGNQSQEYLSNSASQGQFSDPGTYSFDFEATGTQLNLSFIVNQASSYGYISNVSVKEAMPVRDYSADIKGSGTNKTLTAVGNAGVGYGLGNYYGSAMTFDNDGVSGSGNTDVINVPTSSDFVFTGDVTMECWIYPDGIPASSSMIVGQWQSGAGTNRNFEMIFQNDKRVIVYFNSSATNYNTGTSPVLALNQWYHIAVEKYGSVFTLYVNGVAVSVNTNTPTAGNTSTVPFTIGSESNGSNGADFGFNGRIQDVRVYKGVAKYKGGFDVPKPYTPVGIEAFRTTTDTCKNNFATLNSLLGIGRQDQLTYSDGNLKVVSGATGGSDTTAASNIAIKGKIYCEFYLADDGLGAYVGVMKYNTSLTNNGIDTTASSDCWIIRGDNEHKANGVGGSGTSYGSGTFSTGDIIMIAVDIDNTSIWWGKNGTWYASGNPATNSNAAYTNLPSSDDLLVICGDNYSSETPTINVNFGQNPSFSGTTTAGTNADDSGKGLFKYAPPTGFLALCEDNLPTPAIADPGDHFKTVLYTGDGRHGHSITGVGFKPDFVWLKGRTSNSLNHILCDSIRGPKNTLFTNNTLGQYTDRGLSSFDQDGFTLLSAGGDENNTTLPGAPHQYVAWCWKAGGAAVSNTDGSITSQVSANQTAGFSIVSYVGNGNTNQTVGHGLNKRPSLVIYKDRDSTNQWRVIPIFMNDGYYLSLSTSTGRITSSTSYFGTNSSSVLGISGSNSGIINTNTNKIIAYCFAEIEGYSKIGSYTGNGNTDGPFVYCGFKPAFLLVKLSSTTNGHWILWDSSRTPTNLATTALSPNNNWADTNNFDVDLLSNGFKQRDTETSLNLNGETYIFMAFAESPFQTANAK